MTEDEFISKLKNTEFKHILIGMKKGPRLNLLSKGMQCAVQLTTKSGEINIFSPLYSDVEIKEPANKTYIHSLFYDKIGREVQRLREIEVVIDRVALEVV